MQRLIFLIVLGTWSLPAPGQEFVEPSAKRQEFVNPIKERWKLLRGLPGVIIDLKNPYPLTFFGFSEDEVAVAGATTAVLKNAAEIYLTRQGIAVFESLDDAGDRVPILDIFVGPLAQAGPVSVSYRVDLLELVQLQSTPSMITLAATWQAGQLAFVERDELKDIQIHLLDLLDEFIEDYNRANPDR